MKTIAIIGSGPTGIYTAMHLAQSGEAFSLTMFESQKEAGKGTPYHQDWNDEQMLSNIASIELPPIHETLLAWVERQSDDQLDQWGVLREEMHERTFFPRVTLGEYFKAQLLRLNDDFQAKGQSFTLKARHHVEDVRVGDEDITLHIKNLENAETYTQSFDYVVMATGHVWPKETEIRPGYFLSPWPASALGTIRPCHVGVRGTSLSGIDAVVALARGFGAFWRDDAQKLSYKIEPGNEAFRVTMLSRKGLLPEADFYYPIPYEPMGIFTPDTIESVLAEAPPHALLDRIFDLFKAQLTESDPAYAEKLGLADAGLEAFTQRYFQEREANDTFEWARKNLAEAQHHQQRQITVQWRYTILRMHEVIKNIVPHLSAEDYKRFNRFLKPVFVDDYATVPHESIERLLALREAGLLDVVSVGEDYVVDTKCAAGGAHLSCGALEIHFPAFIEAMGQRALSVHEFPFPSLWEQGIIQNATAEHISYTPLGKRVKKPVEIGGIQLDGEFHPVSDSPYAERLYCLSIPFMLSQFPFAQGITSSHEMGQQVALDIIRHITEEEGYKNLPSQPQIFSCAV